MVRNNVTYTFNCNGSTFPTPNASDCSGNGCRIVDVQYNHTFHSEPSDGVVIRSSAAGFPGANHVKLMPGSNHQQMRNDSNTKKNQQTFTMAIYGTFFKVDTRYLKLIDYEN
ncbi:MAG: hypothetical protein R2879_13420 [Saprospiraceae bacterium]